MKSLVIKTGARLHFNSLLMNDSFGRGCGGVGLKLKEPILKIKISKSDKMSFCAPDDWLNDLGSFTLKILRKLNIESNVKVSVIKCFPRHVGLGSETQLGMCLSRGISTLFDKKLDYKDIVKLLDVGGVSGVGYYGFISGGFIIDGGYPMGEDKFKKNFSIHSENPPCLVGRYIFPKEWKILLIIPKNPKKCKLPFNEDKFFKNLPEILLEENYKLCFNAYLMAASVQDRDYEGFVSALYRLSQLGSKKAEIKLNKNYYKEIKSRLKEIIGQEIPFLAVSSLGATMYSVLLYSKETNDIVEKIKSLLKDIASVSLVSVNNSGQD